MHKENCISFWGKSYQPQTAGNSKLFSPFKQLYHTYEIFSVMQHSIRNKIKLIGLFHHSCHQAQMIINIIPFLYTNDIISWILKKKLHNTLILSRPSSKVTNIIWKFLVNMDHTAYLVEKIFTCYFMMNINWRQCLYSYKD